MNQPTILIGMREVLRRTSMSRSTVYALMKVGAFPRAVHLGKRRVGFVESEIDEWLKAKIEASRNVD